MKLKSILLEQEVDLTIKKAFDAQLLLFKIDLNKLWVDVQRGMKDESEIQNALKDAPPQLVKMVSDNIKYKNNVLRESEEYKRLNEETTSLVSVILALPKLVLLIEKFVKGVTIKMGGKGLVGQKMKNFTRDMLEMYSDELMKMLKAGLFKLPPLDGIGDTKQQKIVKVITATMVISLAAYSGTAAINGLKSSTFWKAPYDNVLSATRGGEDSIKEFLATAISQIIATGSFPI